MAKKLIINNALSQLSGGGSFNASIWEAMAGYISEFKAILVC